MAGLQDINQYDLVPAAETPARLSISALQRMRQELMVWYLNSELDQKTTNAGKV